MCCCSLLYCLLQAKKSKFHSLCIQTYNLPLVKHKNNPFLGQYSQPVSSVCVWAVKIFLNFLLFLFSQSLCIEEAIEVRGEALFRIAALSLKAVDGLLLQHGGAAVSFCGSDFSLMESNPNTSHITALSAQREISIFFLNK